MGIKMSFAEFKDSFEEEIGNYLKSEMNLLREPDPIRFP